MYYWLKKWQKKLGIKTPLHLKKIPREVVYCDYRVPYHLVGVSGDTIYYDRPLTEEDIIHELLHLKYPRYKETTIRRMTNENLLHSR